MTRWALLLAGRPSMVAAQGADEGFGNPWMANLVEVEPPPPVPWWPPAPGWYLLAGVIAAVLAWAAWRAWRRWRGDAYRREALRRLAELERSLARPGEVEPALAALPGLLKRTALAAYPRREVASLGGEGWRAFLDRTGSSRDFTTGPGARVPDLAYSRAARAAVGDDEARRALAAVRRWVRRHRRPGRT